MNKETNFSTGVTEQVHLFDVFSSRRECKDIGDAHITNFWYCDCDTLEFKVGKLNAYVRPVLEPQPDIAEYIQIIFSSVKGTAKVFLEAEYYEDFLGGIFDGVEGNVFTRDSIFLEYVLDDLISDFEAKFSAKFDIDVSIVSASELDMQQLLCGEYINPDGKCCALFIEFKNEFVDVIRRQISAYTRRKKSTPSTTRLAAVVEYQRVLTNQEAVSRLDVGDVILSSQTTIPINQPYIVIADCLFGDCEPIDPGNPEIRNLVLKKKIRKMPMSEDIESADMEQTVNGIPVTLSFELARLELPMAEVSSLKPGGAIELGEAINKEIVIRANGKRIGTGELVKINGEPGVQVIRIFTDG